MASKICKNCNKEYTGRSNASKYCGNQCAIEQIKKTFSCKVHGKIDPGLISIRETINNGCYGTCFICKKDNMRLSRRSGRDELVVKCRSCRVEFCRVGLGRLLYCSTMCHEFYLASCTVCAKNKDHKEFSIQYRKSGRPYFYCKECVRDHQRKDHVKIANKEANKMYKLKNYETVKARANEAGKRYSKRAVENLEISYVKKRMVSRTRLSTKDIPDELAEIQKLKMLINRKKREILNENS